MSNTLLTGVHPSSMTPVFERLNRNVVAQSGVPVVAPAAGTIGDNGALSALPVALPKAYPNAWIILQAGKLFTGSPAGIYFVRFSTTTAGTIYNIRLPVGAVPYVPTITEIVNANFVTTGPGAFTGNVATDVFISIKVPGKSIGPNGVLSIKAAFSGNGAGNPTTGIGFGAVGDVSTEIHKIALGTNLQASYDVSYRNQGVEDAQYTSSIAAQDGTGVTAAAALYPTVNTAIDQWVNIGMHIGSIAGGVQLEGFTIEIVSAQ